MKPAVDLLICTRNRAEDLAATLANLQRPEVTAGLDVALTVVDNGSTDTTRAVIERGAWAHLPPRYVSCVERGLSAARNAALASTEAPYAVFIDDDVHPTAGWLAAMIRPLSEGVHDAVVGTIRPAPHLRRPWLERALASAFALNDHESVGAPVQLIGANMGFGRAVLENVPGFDTRLDPGKLGYGGDTLFSLQLKEAGLRVGRAPDAVVDHHFGPDRLTRRAILGSVRGFARSRVYINRRYGLWEERGVWGRSFEVLAKLGAYYLTHPWVFWRREGCSNREFKLRNHAAYYTACLTTRKREP